MRLTDTQYLSVLARSRQTEREFQSLPGRCRSQLARYHSGPKKIPHLTVMK